MLKREATQARVLILKHDPEVCVSKNNTIIAFGRESETVRFASEVGTQPLCLTKDVRSVFGLRRGPCVWHETYV